MDNSSVKITFNGNKFCWRKEEGEKIILAAVGDIGLSEEVNANIEKNGYFYPFEKLFPEIQEADIKFGNLESVLFHSGTKIPYHKSKLYAPADFIKCFNMVGFDVLNLANNHIMDFGPAALLDTLEVIKNANIYGIGVGKNRDEARLPAMLEVNGIRVGFLGYAQNEGTLAGRYSFGAAYEKPRHIRQDIQKLKEKVNHVVVSLHTDTEFSDYPSPSHIQLCHKIVNWGANLILCHHSHVPQGIEIYNGALICYSLGNCVFQIHENSYQQKGNPLTKCSYVLKICLDRKGPLAVELVPFRITSNHCPEPLYGKEQEELLKHLQKITDGIKNPLIVWKAWEKICRLNYNRHWRWMKWEFKRRGWKWIQFHLKILFGRNTHRKWIFGFFSAWLINKFYKFSGSDGKMLK